MSNRETSRTSKGPLIAPLMMVLVGLLLLLSNFFLLGDFNLLGLWPILLVIIGAQILLRGDLTPSNDFRTFGITRGSIESATLTIDAGEIDVMIRALQTRNTERLIAGQYANQARPQLDVQDVHAYLSMKRQYTPWLSFANWEMGISQDLPWQIVASTSLGQVSVDCSQVIVQNALIHTGLGDIQLISPSEAFETIYLHSLFGNITVITPPNYAVRITVNNGHFFGIHVDETRYEMLDDGAYLSLNADEHLPVVDVVIRGTFGDAYLS
ncbi:MAG: hypothetical protein ACFE0Q_14735 [Anaerolineae bacterium]